MSGCPGGIEGCLCTVVDELRAQLAGARTERDEARRALAAGGPCHECGAVEQMCARCGLEAIASLSIERDRLRAALEPTPENITEIASSIDRNRPEWWKYEVAAVLAAIRAKAGLP